MVEGMGAGRDPEGFAQRLAGLRAACEASCIQLPDAAIRWMLFHSSLVAGDSILLGNSSYAQLHELLDGLPSRVGRELVSGPAPLHTRTPPCSSM
jgi:hypothetical protein